MYYFTLCDFFYNYGVINYFINLLDQHPEYFINSNICFNCYQGSYSYFYFNGDFNNNNGPTTLTPNFKTRENLDKKPIRFSMSNLYIENNDNSNENEILDNFVNCKIIDVSNYDLIGEIE